MSVLHCAPANSGRAASGGRTFTEAEARALAVAAALEALTRFAAARPVPSSVTLGGAAEILGVSTRTVARMKLPRTGTGRIPYSAVLDVLAAR